MNNILDSWINLKYYIEKDTNINVDNFDKLLTEQLGECDHDPQSIGRYATGAGIHCAKCDDLLEPAGRY